MIMGVLYSNEIKDSYISCKTTAPAPMAAMTEKDRYTEDSSIDTSPVDQYLSILQDHIYSLRADIIDLVHRLEPVLSPAIEEAVPKTALPATTCQMSVVVSKFVYELQEMQELVQSVRRRLQL